MLLLPHGISSLFCLDESFYCLKFVTSMRFIGRYHAFRAVVKVVANSAFVTDPVDVLQRSARAH
jgi:hypothetical protein